MTQEFKGTKGKWYRNTKSRIVSSVYSENSEKLIHISGGNNVEAQANAQLIAHAPEMLEAMQEFCERVERGEVRSKKTYAKFKELINKATTI